MLNGTCSHFRTALSVGVRFMHESSKLVKARVTNCARKASIVFVRGFESAVWCPRNVARVCLLSLESGLLSLLHTSVHTIICGGITESSMCFFFSMRIKPRCPCSGQCALLLLLILLLMLLLVLLLLSSTRVVAVATAAAAAEAAAASWPSSAEASPVVGQCSCRCAQRSPKRQQLPAGWPSPA